jgi:membrane protein YfhO
MQGDIAERPSAASDLPGHVEESPPDGGPWPSRRALALEGLVVYLALQLLTIPFLEAIRARGQTFYNDVLLGFFGPEKHGLARLLRQGVLPVWLNDQYGGEPLLANLQHAVLYPGNLPFWLLPTSTALELVVAVHLAFAGLGMWAYCRVGLRAGRWGSAVAGLVFGFGSVALAHIILLNQLQVIAWMPLVLLFGHLALERGRLRWVVLCGVMIGLQLLAGHPEEWVYTLAALATYGLAWSLAVPGDWPRRAVAAALRLGGAVVVFGLLFAWQLLPTLLLQRQGYRTAPTFDQQYPLPGRLAFNALLPDYGRVLIGENEAFIGLVALALAGLGIWAGPRRLRWVRVWALVISLLAVVMALGNQNPLYRLAYRYLGVVQEFRVPSRYLLLCYFALAAAAALGTDALLGRDVGRLAARVRQGLGGLAVVGLVLGFALVVGGHSSWEASRRGWALAAAAGVVAWVVAGWRRVPRVAVAVLLLSITAVELRQARPAAEYHETVPSVIYNDPGPILQRMGGQQGRYVSIAPDRPRSAAERKLIELPKGITGVMASYYWITWPRRLAAQPAWEYATNAETITGRDGGLLPLRTYQEFFTAAVNATGELAGGVTPQAPSRWGWPALDLLGVRWFVTGGLPPDQIKVLETEGFRIVQRDAWFLLWQRAPPPLARMQYQVDVVPDPQDRLARLQAGYPLLTRAMVEEPVAGLQRPAVPPRVQLVERGRTRVRVAVETATDGLLVLADPWYPQWRVAVDGHPAELLRVDHALRGVRVPAGSHRVTFTYQDRALWLGATLALTTCLALAGLWMLRRRRGTEALAAPAGTQEHDAPTDLSVSSASQQHPRSHR